MSSTVTGPGALYALVCKKVLYWSVGNSTSWAVNSELLFPSHFFVAMDTFQLPFRFQPVSWSPRSNQSKQQLFTVWAAVFSHLFQQPQRTCSQNAGLSQRNLCQQQASLAFPNICRKISVAVTWGWNLSLLTSFTCLMYVQNSSFLFFTVTSYSSRRTLLRFPSAFSLG